MALPTGSHAEDTGKGRSLSNSTPLQPQASFSGESQDRRALLQNALLALESMENKLAAAERAQREPIAIVGMACRFPDGIDSPDSYWAYLEAGRCAVKPLPSERQEVARAFGFEPGEHPEEIGWFGGYLNNLDQFDPQFFGITPREAITMDPQQRLLLEVSWEALENAGIAPDTVEGSNTGVFVGISTNDYPKLVALQGYDALDAYAATGGSMNVAAGRISFSLGLQGPCLAVDTACSSSLAAIHLAVRSLRNRECNMALAGGVNVVLAPDGFATFRSWGMMSKDGNCKSFDADADGFVRSEGCGVIVCKRLPDAIADGDNILAVIRGTAVNQDGRSSGLTVPNGPAQEAMLRLALADANILPSEVQHIEAHGTGTAVGDPIEVEAIGAVLREGRNAATPPLILTSVKTNIGHAESASGIAGLIKLLLSMQRRTVPPHLHLKQRSPAIPWPPFEIAIPDRPMPWEGVDGRLVAGISGFGFSGTNAHIVLTSPDATDMPDRTAVASRSGASLLPISAKSPEALRSLALRYAEWLDAHPDANVETVSVNALRGRARFPFRFAVAGATPEEMSQSLHSFAEGETPAVARRTGANHRIAFLFTGQGSQFAGMGKRLYATEPAFRQAFDQCDAIMQPLLGRSIRETIFEGSDEELAQTGTTQPALFCLEYALLALWRSWGVEPHAVLGHSVGEYVAAVAAGIMTLEVGARLIVERGRLLQSLPEGGAMTSIAAPEAEVRNAIAGRENEVSIGAINGPAQTVISGTRSAVDAIAAEFAARGVACQALRVSHAFHSHLVDPILDDFYAAAAHATFHAPRIAFISNVTGAVASDEVARPAYWRDHIRAAVRFNDGIDAMLAEGCTVFIEIGPQATLINLAQARFAEAKSDPLRLASMRRNRDEQRTALESFGALWQAGLRVSLDRLYSAEKYPRLQLPTYPFQRSSYWVDLAVVRRFVGSRGRAKSTVQHPLLGRRVPLSQGSERIYEASFSVREPAYLGDHQVGEHVLMPGTAYVEMVLAAAAAEKKGAFHIRTLGIREPMILGDVETVVQIVLAPTPDDEARVTVSSLRDTGNEGDEPAWVLHAEATVQWQEERALRALPTIDATVERFLESEEGVETYARFEEKLGLHYGPTFRGVQRLYKGEDEALGLVELSGADHTLPEYLMHPALLDACLHVLSGVSGSAETALPVAFSGVHLYQPLPARVWSEVHLKRGAKGARSWECQILIRDEAGALLAEIDRLELMQLASASATRLNTLFHVVEWRESALPEAAPSASSSEGIWLLAGTKPDLLEEMRATLHERGERAATLLLEGESGDALPAGQIQEFVAAATADAAGARVKGVLVAWGQSTAKPGMQDAVAHLWQREERLVTASLALLRALEQHPARIWVVTEKTQSIAKGDRTTNPDDATLWGLGRVAAQEFPLSRWTSIDVASLRDDEMARALVDEVLANAPDEVIGYRAGQRYVGRFVKRAPIADATLTEPYRLTFDERGVLENMRLAPLAIAPPKANEVTVEVRTTGVNFRDVLNVLGMYPGDPGMPGVELAGVVTAVGEGVTDLQPGDSVAGFAGEAFSALVNTPVSMVVRKPAGLSFVDAATVPSAFITAWYGLVDLAGIQPGQTVLVHAAAGGVGLAAVQIARMMGARVIATAGSAEKHAFLHALGVEHVFSSRHADFFAPVMELTEGRGVDIVLNSLSEEFIVDSFRALAQGGVFLEIGKRNIFTQEQAQSARPDVAYHVYDMTDYLLQEPVASRQALADIFTHIETGRMSALPSNAFPIEEIVDAFRWMAQAKHIGKIVLTHRPALWREKIMPDGAYLVTGGLGGIGRKVAEWLAAQGAGHIALIGRTPASGETAEWLAAQQEQGASMASYVADIADPAATLALLEQIRSTGKKVRAVFHAAGVLDDGLLQNQEWSRFAGVLAPKAAGALNLHSATAGDPLDHFVLFSSGSSILGNMGQGNYAAANAFLDAFAHSRHSAGLPALSINWGPWTEVGMAARLGENQRGATNQPGITPIKPEQGIAAMVMALGGSQAQTAVLAVDWNRIFQGRDAPPFLSELVRQRTRTEGEGTKGQQRSDPAAFYKQLLESAADARHSLLLDRIRQHAGQVMGLSAGSLMPDAVLSDMGLDSLIAVELKNRLDADLRTSVSIENLFGSLSIGELAGALLATVDLGASGDSIHTNGSTQDGTGAQSSPAADFDVDQMSNDEVEAMLRALLGNEESDPQA